MAYNVDNIEVQVKTVANEATASLSQIAGIFKTIQNRSDNASKSIAKIGYTAQNSLVKVQKNLTPDKKGLISTFSSINSSLTSVVTKVGALYIGLKKILSVYRNANTQAIDYVENLNLYQVAMGKNLTQGMTFQQQMNNLMGTNMSEFLKYQGTFMQLATGMGVANKQAFLLSENFTKLTLDLSSLWNISQKSAFEKLSAGISGQTKPLRTVGIDITENSLRKTAQGLGLDTNMRTMSQASKIGLRYISIIKQATNAQGDFARTIESPANQLKIFQNQIAELSRYFANLFLGLFSQALPYINAVLMVLKEIVQWIGILVGVKTVTSPFKTTADDVADVGIGASDANKKVKELKNSLQGFDQLNIVEDPNASKGSGSTSGGAISNLGEMDPKIAEAMKSYENSMTNIKMQATEIRDKILNWLGFTVTTDEKTGAISIKLKEGYTNLEKIRDIAIAIGTALLGWKIVSFVSSIGTTLSSLGLLTPIVTGLTTIFGTLAGAITPILIVVGVLTATIIAIKQLWDTNEEFKSSMTSAWDGIKDTLQKAYDGIIKPILSALDTLFKSIWEDALKPLWDGFKDMIGSILIDFAGLWEKLKPIFDWLINIFKYILPVALAGFSAVFSGIFTFIGGIFNTFFSSVKDIFGGVIKIFGGIINFITGVFTGNWKKAWNGIKDIISGVFKSLWGIVKVPINLIISGINALISGINVFIRSINKIVIPKWVPIVGGKKLNFPTINTIKYLANGGLPSVGEMFIAREAGPELVGKMGNSNAVVNNNQIIAGVSQGVAQAVSSVLRGNSNSNNQPINLTVQIGEDKFIKNIISGINNEIGQTNKFVFNVPL